MGSLGFALGGDTSCTGLVDGINSVTIGAIITGGTNKYVVYKGWCRKMSLRSPFLKMMC